MAGYTYKNVSENVVVIPNVGEVEPGKTVVTNTIINSPNLARVKLPSKSTAITNPPSRKANK